MHHSFLLYALGLSWFVKDFPELGALARPNDAALLRDVEKAGNGSLSCCHHSMHAKKIKSPDRSWVGAAFLMPMVPYCDRAMTTSSLVRPSSSAVKCHCLIPLPARSEMYGA